MFRSKYLVGSSAYRVSQFQSLFSWMFRSKRAAARRDRGGTRVSILVLVDVSLEVYWKRGDREPVVGFNPCSRGCFARSTPEDRPDDRSEGFNPCSRGCFARSLCVLLLLLGVMGFQSLFSWMFRSKRIHHAIGRCPCLFQSLFSWMFRSKAVHPPQEHDGLSFNPCSRGCFARKC